MAELTGEELIRDINECQVSHGELVIWWMGQHSFVLKAGQTVIYLDPFLTELPGRLVAPLLRPEQVTNADIICGSHDHDDHIDRGVWPQLAVASPQATFIVPDLLRANVAEDLKLPLPRLVGLDDGRSVEIQGIRISAVAAAHEFLDRDPLSGRYPYLGFVIEANGCVLYHSGDSCIYEGLQTRLKQWHVDIALLPINGRDATRLAAGCIGNMTYQEAADLAGALQPALTIPAHYDMFAMNSQNPQPFVDYMRVKYPHLSTTLLRYGAAFRFRQESRP
jgi:L-ascorbate 6-phosphate lactonase